MSEVPSGWVTADLGDLGELRLGKMLDKARNQGLPTQYLRNTNVRWFEFDLTDLQTLLLSEEERELFSVRNGDLFVCEGGEPGRCAVWSSGENPLVYQKALHRFRGSGAIVPRFLMYRLRRDADSGDLQGAFTGTTIRHLTQRSLLRYQIALPPLNEQRRIADKLEAVLARVDGCRKHFDRVPTILSRFRKVVLAAAFSGKLTEEWRDANPSRSDATDLTRAVRDAHEMAGGHKAGNAAPPTDGVHDLTTGMFPRGWRLLFLRELVSPDRPITYGILKPGPDLKEGVSYVRVSDFPDEEIEFSKIRKTSLQIDEKFKRSRLKEGDLLLSIRGTVGRLVAIPAELEMANITQDSARLSIQSSINRDYVLWYLRSELAQDRMRRAIKGVAIRGINIGDVRALQVPLPSRDEQNEVVDLIETWFAFADRLEACYAIARRRIDRLTPVIFSKAFRGELVRQDPGDEPVIELLERIDAERKERMTTQKLVTADSHTRKSYKKKGTAMLSRKNVEGAYLTDILRERGPLTAEALWSASQLDIDHFYDQLKEEEVMGRLKERRGETPSTPRLLEATE